MEIDGGAYTTLAALQLDRFRRDAGSTAERVASVQDQSCRFDLKLDQVMPKL